MKKIIWHTILVKCVCFNQSSESQYENNEWLNVMHVYFRQTIEFQIF